MDKATYEKGGSAGSKGTGFQVSLLTVILLNALQRLKRWRLSTENKEAGKFDDVVLEWPEGVVLLQAKHKENKKRITLEDLLSINSKNDDFSLAKYFLSYQQIKNAFKIKNVVVCTNSDIHEKALRFFTDEQVPCDSILYYEEACTFYKLNDDILPILKEKVMNYYKNNSPNQCFDESVIADVKLREFLEHFQFYSNFPSGKEVEKIIDKLLSLMKSSSNIYHQATSIEIHAKVMDWFQQIKGVYLTECLATALFLEILSEKRWQVLEQYNVHFQREENFHNSKQLIHFKADSGYILQQLRIYRALQQHKTKTLYAVLDDDADGQRRIVEAFQLSKYTYLLIVVPTLTRKSRIRELCTDLRGVLKRCKYKKLILVSICDNQLIRQIQSNDVSCDVVEESVSFADLAEVTQKRLLKQKNILFQGQDISLEELLGTQTSEIYNTFMSSDILQSLLQGEKVVVGTEVRALDEDIARFYINRLFSRKSKKEEYDANTIPEDTIYNVDEKTILIADSAGMGKSTVLAKIANSIKNKYPHLWVIRIELNDYTRILNCFLNKETKTITLLDLLNSKDSTKLMSHFEERVFSMKEKVVLMLDGVDEISPDYTQLVVSLLVYCRRAINFAKVFVTTRPHITKELQSELRTEPFVLESFSEECQIGFLTSYWSHNLKLKATETEKCKRYANALLKKMFNWTREPGYSQYEFGGIPLQIKMLAEIFQENNTFGSTVHWDGCREYVNMDKEEPSLPEKNITQLYEMFIEKKRSIFIEKENPRGYVLANQTFNAQFDKCLDFYRRLAVEVILGETQSERFSSLQDVLSTMGNMETAMLKIGIVQKIDDTYSFIHRTFAEYFVAECLLREFQVEKQNPEFLSFVLNDVLTDYIFTVVRAFLDSLLRQNSSITFNSFYKSTTYSSIEWWCSSRFIHILAGEGYLALLQFVLKCLDFKIKKNKSILPCKRALTFKQIREYLLRDCMFNIRDDFGETPLHRAAQNGHLEMAKFLVEQGASLNVQSKKLLETPLHRSVYFGHFETTKYLVCQGADIELVDGNFSTALHVAIASSHTRITTYLLVSMLQKGTEINTNLLHLLAFNGDMYNLVYLLDHIRSPIENGGIQMEDRRMILSVIENLLFSAVCGKNLDIIRYVLEQGADINKTHQEGNTALHIASLQQHSYSTAELLLELGINADAQNDEGKTALHNASECGNFDLIKLLVKFGVDINARDCNGKTAISLALSGSHLCIVKFLVENGGDAYVIDNDGSTILHLAVSSMAPLDTVKYFLECGVDVHIRDDNGRTALHLAASRKEQVDTVKLLLEQGADITINDNYDYTPLHFAARGGDESVVVYILGLGVDVNAVTKYGRTPLFFAAEENSPEVVELLVIGGAEVNRRDEKGLTALFLAVQKINSDNVRVLVKHKADVNFQDNCGCTPMFFVVSENKSAFRSLTWMDVSSRARFVVSKSPVEIIEILAKNGADVNVRNNEGRTVLHKVVTRAHWVIAKFLIVKLGADVNVKDDYGQTPLHLAARAGRRSVVELLIKQGADYKSKDFSGDTAASLAMKRGHLNVAGYLGKTTPPRWTQRVFGIFRRKK